MNQFHVIALTHRKLGLDLVGKFHVNPDDQSHRFKPHLQAFDIREFMFLSTCNRVEFFYRSPQELNEEFVQRWLSKTYAHLSEEDIKQASGEARLYDGLDAIRHLFHVASSLDSLIVGEREIITQVRDAHKRAAESGLSGDLIRLAIQKTIETAKQVYTETEIAAKPISVVNLGFRKLIERDLGAHQDIVFIGAGKTIEAIAGNLKAYRFKSTKVFNRTREKAEKLAANLGGEGYALEELTEKAGHFDVLITCTAADRAIVDETIFQKLQNGSAHRKIILDLSIPADIDASVVKNFDVDYISINDLQEEARQNLKEREKEIFHCENLVEARLLEFEEAYRTRKLEKAMSEIPQLMKDIKRQALENKFSRDLDRLDPEQRALVEDILNYLEKKYISLPMRMAKQVVLDQDLKDPVVE